MSPHLAAIDQRTQHEIARLSTGDPTELGRQTQKQADIRDDDELRTQRLHASPRAPDNGPRSTPRATAPKSRKRTAGSPSSPIGPLQRTAEERWGTQAETTTVQARKAVCTKARLEGAHSKELGKLPRRANGNRQSKANKTGADSPAR